MEIMASLQDTDFYNSNLIMSMTAWVMGEDMLLFKGMHGARGRWVGKWTTRLCVHVGGDASTLHAPFTGRHLLSSWPKLSFGEKQMNHPSGRLSHVLWVKSLADITCRCSAGHLFTVPWMLLAIFRKWELLSTSEDRMWKTAAEIQS